MSSRIRDILQTEPREQEVTVEGWVKTKRDSKNVTFLEITDGSSFKGIQVIVDHDEKGTFDHLESATTGSSVSIKGKLVASPGKNQTVEVQASEVEIIGQAPADSYPLQKKRHSFEFLREIAHLRPRTNTFGAVTRVRNALSF
ncbi:MAG: OB-fold nucleic acid binding domain-containing protein, partial [Spirochaetota bacterium]